MGKENSLNFKACFLIMAVVYLKCNALSTTQTCFMKLFLILALSAFPALANAQKKDKFYIGVQVQPELTFYKSSQIAVYPPAYSKSSFNVCLNIYGQYQIPDYFSASLGFGFISRKLNNEMDVDQQLLPDPYYDMAAYLYISKTLSQRILQIPVGFAYNFLKTKKVDVFASLTFIPNYLLNTEYANKNKYPAFKKNSWLGFSLNPTAGLDYTLFRKIKLTSALAYSVVNTVREEEYSRKHPKIKHTYLQFSLGAKYKLK